MKLRHLFEGHTPTPETEDRIMDIIYSDKIQSWLKHRLYNYADPAWNAKIPEKIDRVIELTLDEWREGNWLPEYYYMNIHLSSQSVANRLDKNVDVVTGKTKKTPEQSMMPIGGTNRNLNNLPQSRGDHLYTQDMIRSRMNPK